VGRPFLPARFAGAGAPENQSMQYAVGQTYVKGAVVVYEGGATGNIIEGGADPAAIVGVALEACDSKPGFNMNFNPTVVATTGRVRETTIAKANRLTVFTGRIVNGGTDPVTPVQGDVGKTYSILKAGTGEWTLDAADGANQRVRVIDIDIDAKIAFFRFLEANLANP